MLEKSMACRMRRSDVARTWRANWQHVWGGKYMGQGPGDGTAGWGRDHLRGGGLHHSSTGFVFFVVCHSVPGFMLAR